ncbi:hypothetical protein WA026_023184 [Henosepilachna vigintioctopunctata]|uniref:Beta-mannosidase B n=1 Tax=Henosepilachna vigintioctopunctata TaxID=420089 RepID=A0AAW1UGX3_9CUCU
MDLTGEGDNYLEVKFVSPVITAERFASIQNQSYSVPPECPDSVYRGECHINELRKMQASFSWDWGPTLASVGIWKHVFLEGFNSSVIRYCVVETEEISSTSSWQVSIVTFLSGNVKNSVDGKLVSKLKTDNEDTVTLIVDVNAQPDENNNIEVRQNVQIRQGSVKRWWPNGYGEQPLYDITVTFYSENELDTFSHRIGYRTIELVQEEVKISQANYGNSFYFKVNGIPIFAKGSNAIPINILPEKGQERESVDKLLQSARDCHMNMLRVWGGGVYESDYYYQRADELGIMIWQDFMFACALYPSRQDFLDDVIQEVRHQVKRIGSHPSVVMWAGNNENEAAIHGNWYGSNGKQIYFDDYKKLYFGTIKPEFQKILKRGQYIGSSPSNGVESEAEGGISNNPYDEHYGDVHTYIYELDGFNPNIYPIPRFSSEYGFQSYPSFSTFLKASKNKSNLVIGSEFLQHRQHHPFGDAQLELEVLYQMELPDEKSPNYTDVFIFYTQIYQAVSIKTQTERYRKHRNTLTEDGKGLTMGALYWQLNDVWIAPTWSGIDVTGKWKILQYYIRDAFAPIAIIGHLNSKRDLEITIVSDKTTSLEHVDFSISVYNWASFVPVNVTQQNISIEKLSSKTIMTIQTDDYLNKNNCGGLVQAKRNCFLVLKLSKSNTVIAPETVVFPDTLKTLNLRKPYIEIVGVTSLKHIDKRNFTIVLKSSNIALFVWLECLGVTGRFSENGFHQITETKTIYFATEEDTDVETVKKNLFVSNLLSVTKF